MRFETPESIPEPLRTTLRQASAVNQYYNPERLAAEVAADIERVLFGENGQSLQANASIRKIILLNDAISARVAQIVSESGALNPLWQDRDRGSTPNEFARSPRTLSKSMQEVLTHPADRVVVQKRHQVTTEPDDEPIAGDDPALLKHIVVDPFRLSDTFVANMGFEQRLAPSGSSAIDKLCAKVRLIPLVKGLLGMLEPMPHPEGKRGRKNYRLFRVAGGAQRGKVLGTQEISQAERFYVSELYAAKRRIHHIDASYTAEEKELEDIRCTLAEVDMVIAMDWPEARKPWRLQVLLEKLAAVEFKLRHAKDPLKADLYRSVKRASELLAELNMGATRASINKGRRERLLGGRQGAMEHMLGHLSKDKLQLEAQIYKEENGLNWLFGEVNRQEVRPRLSDPHAPLRQDERLALVQKIQRILRRCREDVRFQPNLVFAEKLDVYLSRTNTQLGQAFLSPVRRQRIAEGFVRAYVISKLARFNHFLLALYEVFSCYGANGFVSAPAWKNNLEEAKKELFRRDLADTIYTGEYNQLWKDLKSLITDIEAAIDEYAKDPLLKQNHKDDVKKIKNLIKDFNLPAQVASIRVVGFSR